MKYIKLDIKKILKSWVYFFVMGAFLGTTHRALSNEKDMANNRNVPIGELVTEPESLETLSEIQTVAETQIGAFGKIVVNLQNSADKIIDLNPFSHLNFSSKKSVYTSPFGGSSKTVKIFYTAKRRLRTKLPVEVLNSTDWTQASLQNQLFSDITFTCKSNNICGVQQKVLLQDTTYQMYYQFYNQNQLSALELPEELVNRNQRERIQAALVQYSYNWSKFVASGMNITLFLATEDKKLELMAFQIILLAPTSFVENQTPNWTYKTKISSDINTQTESLENYLMQLGQSK